MRFANSVIHLAPIPLTGQKTAALHQPQMLGGHRAGQLARFRQLADGVIPLQQDLDHSQAVRMGQSTQALSRLPQGI